MLSASFAASATVHAFLLIVLGLWHATQAVRFDGPVLVATIADDASPIEELAPPTEMVTIEPLQSIATMLSSTTTPLEMPVIKPSAAPTVPQLDNLPLPTVAHGELSATVGAGKVATISELRSETGRMARAVENGATEASEAAVAKGLEWLARHQTSDGSWSFDHGRISGCNGKCKNPGALYEAKIGATALALLPFLGTGQTHKFGKHRKVVQGGLFYLVNQMQLTPQGGDLSEPGGMMYSHALAAIALCEAYAMSQDRKLADPAQAALQYIMFAQDPEGGGWRYAPRSPGDTSVLGWQLMALKSGQLGSLYVDPRTLEGASRFLDSVQTQDGAIYGYNRPDVREGTTAIGLLARMHLGWKRSNPALARGIKYLSEKGPSKVDIYYDYYATQVLHQYGGAAWQKWNEQMRDQLVNSQSKIGHETGSWFFPGTENAAGGRLYCTAMATMTLEVYYRQMPLYKKTVDDEEMKRSSE